MFDLEKAIKKWKKPFFKYAVFEDGFIADLELHLRDEYEARIKAGLDGEAAFQAAVTQIGTAESLAAEYDKNRLLRLNRRSPLRPGRFLPALAWNYVKVISRKIKHQKGYSFINITGLGIGMACCILIVLYIRNELSFDTFHEKAERIYSLGVQSERQGYEFRGISSNATAAGVLQDEYPEVAQAVRYGYKNETTFTYEDKRFTMDGVWYADPNVFKVFTWPMIKGDPDTALSAPHTIVVTEKIAAQCFGESDPLGKILKFGDGESFAVTGVVKNVPDNSSIRFDALCSFKTLYTDESLKPLLTGWLNHNYRTFLLLEEGVRSAELEAKFPALLKRFAGDVMRERGATESYFLHPLRQLYLNPPWRTRGPIFYVYIFSLVAGLILVIACFNFMNLSTARSATRAHEVAMRKVLGASRRSLVSQFFSESVFFSFVSLLLAVALVQLVLPAINSLTGRVLRLSADDWPFFVLGFLFLTFFVGLAAGSYPALLLSRFIPVNVLRGRLGSNSSNTTLRRGLVVFQFTISIGLVICTAIIVRQLFYLQRMDPGFDRNNVVIIRADEKVIRESVEVIKAEFTKNPNIIGVAASSTIPGWGYPNNMKIPEGRPIEEAILMDEINADPDFLSAMGIELVAGRNFSREFGMDEASAILINETAVKEFGWTNALGKTIKSADPRIQSYRDMTVIGVVKDFHLRDLTEAIEPVYIGCDPEYPLPYNFMDVISVRIKPDDVPGTLNFMKNRWEKIFANLPFEYSFLDDIFNRQFRDIEQSRKIFSYFSFLAVFVACLGLYGMASFSAVQRTKEIGIRKVLGGTTTGIIALLARELVALILLANLVAWPLSFLAMNKWIQNFPYRVNIGLGVFIVSSLIVLLIGLLTVSHQAVKAALANPIKSLRYE